MAGNGDMPRTMREHRFAERPMQGPGLVASCAYCACSWHFGQYWRFPYRSNAAPPYTRAPLDQSEWRTGAVIFSEEESMAALANAQATTMNLEKA
ncbi:hypothetical protein AX279_17660 [Pseudomonas sp. J237]|nr:hypothetical protein AX279_17660 [Pseudomonas sp. J237]